MAHGWPESWYSWRHQITSLVKNGFKVAVPDMRGYGKTSKPTEIDAYNIMELTSDIIAIADEMKEDNFSLIGHDWERQLPGIRHCIILIELIKFVE